MFKYRRLNAEAGNPESHLVWLLRHMPRLSGELPVRAIACLTASGSSWEFFFYIQHSFQLQLGLLLTSLQVLRGIVVSNKLIVNHPLTIGN